MNPTPADVSALTLHRTHRSQGGDDTPTAQQTDVAAQNWAASLPVGSRGSRSATGEFWCEPCATGVCLPAGAGEERARAGAHEIQGCSFYSGAARFPPFCVCQNLSSALNPLL